MLDPELASDRAKSDVIDCEDIKRIHKASGQRYGARKIWYAGSVCIKVREAT